MAASLLVPLQSSPMLSIKSSTISHYYHNSTSNARSVTAPPMVSLFTNKKHRRRFSCRAMAQQQAVPQEDPVDYAERISARESLLLAFKDAGGFEGLIHGKTTDAQKADVDKKITGLELLNPTPKPTTSPFLEGLWNFEWVGSGTPGFVAAKALFERLPEALANLSSMDINIKDGYGKISFTLKLLDLIEKRLTVTSKLLPEGPFQMKEEVELPFGKTFDRFFKISYVDEEVLILRDDNGNPEVLTRLDPPSSPTAEVSLEEYVG